MDAIMFEKMQRFLRNDCAALASYHIIQKAGSSASMRSPVPSKVSSMAVKTSLISSSITFPRTTGGCER